MAENIYENLQTAQLKGMTLKEPAFPPPSRRSNPTITLLTILVLLLAVLLSVVTVLFFQKERKLRELEGPTQKYNISHLCNTYALLGKSESLQPSQNVSEGFSEIQACLKNAIASQTSLQERYRTQLGLVSAGWKLHNGSFYFFSQEPKSWQEAEQACRSHGAHLTAVTSKEEMDFLVRESNGHSSWIGLTDQREEGHWIWTDGTKYSPQVSFWAKDQPDNWASTPEKREDCVHFRHNKMPKSWNDSSCSAKMRWICKKVFS